jgi:hypothetical protein
MSFIFAGILTFFTLYIIKIDTTSYIQIFYLVFSTLALLISSFLAVKPLFDISLGSIMKKHLQFRDLKIVNNANIMPKKLPIVAIVIPIYNDFMEREIKQSFIQSYKGKIKYYILDDSTDINQIERINKFANENNVCVLHQTKENREKYKKNHGLASAFNFFIQKTKGE